MIILAIELAEDFGRDASIVRLLSIATERMLLTEQGTIELLASYHLHPRTIDQELLTVVFQNHLQLFLGKSGMHQHIGNDGQCLRKVLVERIECHEAAIGRGRQFQPSAIIIQLLGYL